MSGNIVSFVIDGMGGFLSSPVFRMAVAGWSAILAPAILHNVKKNNE